MSKKFEIEMLEDRIAPSSLSLGSLADNVLSGVNASGAGSGDSLLSGNDPSVANNAVSALMGNTASLGGITSVIQG